MFLLYHAWQPFAYCIWDLGCQLALRALTCPVKRPSMTPCMTPTFCPLVDPYLWGLVMTPRYHPTGQGLRAWTVP